MAKQSITKFIYLFLPLLLGTTFADVQYFEYGLDHEDICHPSKNDFKSIKNLKTYNESAILIKPSHVFDTWSRVRYNKYCNFEVKVKGQGIAAVIQRMSFRQEGSGCLDYIRFIDSQTDRPTEKYCGKIENVNGAIHYSPFMISNENRDPMNQDNFQYQKGMFEFFSSSGKIKTEIFISKKPLQLGQELDLVVVYTPYKDCTNASCVHSKFVCDGYANCASLICSDESNCTNLFNQNSFNRVESDGTGTRVTVSAVTTIILCFIIFTLCLWICRKHNKLCWSPDCAGPSTTVSGSASGLPMERGDRSAPNPPYVPSAPMLEVAVPTSLHDKDLPPSYDSLFPNQASTVNNS